MNLYTLAEAILDLFDGGAGGAGGAGGGAAGASGSGSAAGGEGAAATTGDTNGTPRSTRRGKSGDYDNVIFGKQAADGAEGSSAAGSDDGAGSQTQVTSSTTADRRKAYDDLINGEYKDFYTEDTQKLINRRFKGAKEMESRLAKQQPLIDMMMARYGIEDGDTSKLSKAIDDDEAWWESAAESAGFESGDQYRQNLRFQMEHQELEAIKRQQSQRAQAQQQMAVWNDEAAAMQAKYPGFDLNTEAANPDFLALLKAHIPMEQAYKTVHMEEILQAATQQTESQIVANIRAKGTRPTENGGGGKSAFVVKSDPSKWTRKDRAEVARRAAQGEIINL